MAAALAGCASAPPVLQPASPAGASGQQYGLAGTPDRLLEANNTQKYIDPAKTLMYSQHEGGGGVALGVLLGPIGMMTNVKMIEAVTDADVAKLKGFSLDPRGALQQAASITGFHLKNPASPADVKVVPLILVSKTDETHLNVSALIILDAQAGDKNGVRRYRYEMSGSYTLDELSALDAARMAQLQAESVGAFAALLRHIAGETDSAIAKEPKIIVTSAYLTPRFVFDLAGSLIRADADRVWVRTTAGVFAVAPTDLKYKNLN
jgi:hypothetical protein